MCALQEVESYVSRNRRNEEPGEEDEDADEEQEEVLPTPMNGSCNGSDPPEDLQPPSSTRHYRYTQAQPSGFGESSIIAVPYQMQGSNWCWFDCEVQNYDAASGTIQYCTMEDDCTDEVYLPERHLWYQVAVKHRSRP